jgi:hypothetical protein
MTVLDGQARSNLAEVRNPVLKLDAAHRLQAMSPLSRAELRGVLLELRSEAKAEGDKAWRTSKYMMAAYWKVVSVYAGHIARVLR